MTDSGILAESPVEGQVPRFELPEWRDRWGLVAGITGRGSGIPFDYRLAAPDPSVGPAPARWHALLAAVPGFHGVVVSRQVHGDSIQWHEDATGLTIMEGLDGHATATAGVLLAVTAADCVPVYLADPVRRVIALVHAGWRGTAAGILPRAIGLLVARGSLVNNIVIHCGVGICGACYEVGSEVLAACGFEAARGSKGRLDLRGVLTRQARKCSVQRVTASAYCSAHDGRNFFSHRASGGAEGRMVAYLGLPDGGP